MKRTLIEVFLAIALIGASVFGWMNWKQNGAAAPQITELKAAAEEAEKTAKTSEEAVKAAEEAVAALRKEMAPLESKVQQLEAVKAALANGTTLSDLEAAYKKEKNLSAERQVGLGALRMLTKGANDPATLESFRKALQISDFGNRKNTICAAQIGLAAAGEKVTIMSECLPKDAKDGKGEKSADKDAKSDGNSKADDKHAKADGKKGGAHADRLLKDGSSSPRITKKALCAWSTMAIRFK